MDCKMAQKLIRSFYNHNLQSQDLALEFIEHVSACKDCKEELSIYYIIDTCNNDSEPATYDFIELVDKDLQERKKQIDAHTNFVIFRMGVWTSANIIVFLVLLGWITGFLVP